MSTILLIEDNAADRALVRRAVFGTDHTLIEAERLDDILATLTPRRIDLVVISLSLVSDASLPTFQRFIAQLPDAKVLALTPVQEGDGLAILLKAESLRAHHMLPKPLDPKQFLTLVNLVFPADDLMPHS